MTLPSNFSQNLSLPVVVAPMFLISNPDLVVACCKEGVVGTFPSLNQRTTEEFEAWVSQIKSSLSQLESEGLSPAPFGVNLIVHKTNPRVMADLEVCVKHKVPLVITSLGAAKEVVDAVHRVIVKADAQFPFDAGTQFALTAEVSTRT